MGCEMSTLHLQQAGVVATIHLQYDYLYLDPNESITFYCPSGEILSDGFGIPISGGSSTVVCPGSSAGQDDYTPLSAPNLQCIDPATPSPTPPPTNAPTTLAPTTLAPTATTLPAPRSGTADSPTATPIDFDATAVCSIAQMDGVVAYQASSNEHQVEVVRFPLSHGTETDADDGSESSDYYQLGLHETVTFVCENDEQEMLIDGVSLQPHNVNFYTFTCTERDTTSISTLNLTCQDRQRKLRGGN